MRVLYSVKSVSWFHVVGSHSTGLENNSRCVGHGLCPCGTCQVGRKTTDKQGHRGQQGVAPGRISGRTSQDRGIPQILGESLQDRVSVSASLTVPKLSSFKEQWVIISHLSVGSLGSGRQFLCQISPVIGVRCWTELETAEVSTRLDAEMASSLTSGIVE